MSFLNSIDVSASGLTAQRLRMDTIASNMANVETTRVANGKGPYRRHVVVFEAQDDKANKSTFEGTLEDQINALSGVKVKEIKELSDTEAPYRRVYEPSHPDADAQGYVNYPNVNVVEEMINMISSNRAYEANTKVIESTRAMALKALEIGR
jgi:flagellar basal-body rod protein FlgC